MYFLAYIVIQHCLLASASSKHGRTIFLLSFPIWTAHYEEKRCI